jgi:hypothetical protein
MPQKAIPVNPEFVNENRGSSADECSLPETYS